MLSILSFPYDGGFAFYSRLSSLGCVALMRNVLGSVLPASLSPYDEGLEYAALNGSLQKWRTPSETSGSLERLSVMHMADK